MQEHTQLYEHHAKRKASPAELELLQEHEPQVVFREIMPPGVSQGRQSRVSILAYEIGHDIHHVIWKRMGAAKDLTPDEAEDMHGRLMPYRHALESFGWQLPKLFYARVAKINREAQIFSYEEFIPGGDGETMVADPDIPQFRKWHLVQETLRVLFSYDKDLPSHEFSGKKLHILPVGLDLKAANVVLSATTDQLHFVDLFGPKEIGVKGDWLLYSPKLEPLPSANLMAVCGTREGVTLRFWRLTRRLWIPRDRKERRVPLDQEFLENLALLDPPENELETIRQEIQAGYPWLDQVYKEHRV